MSPTETLHDAAEATREYAKGIDRATAIRRLFAFWIVFMVIVSVVPPAVVVTADHGTGLSGGPYMFYGGSTIFKINSTGHEVDNISFNSLTVRDIEYDTGDNTLYVLDDNADQVIEIDPSDMSHVANHSIKDGMHAVDIGKDGKFYISYDDGTVEIRNSSFAVENSVDVGTDADDILVGGNFLYVINTSGIVQLSDGLDETGFFDSGDDEKFLAYDKENDELYTLELVSGADNKDFVHQINTTDMSTNQSKGGTDDLNGLAYSEEFDVVLVSDDNADFDTSAEKWHRTNLTRIGTAGAGSEFWDALTVSDSKVWSVGEDSGDRLIADISDMSTVAGPSGAKLTSQALTNSQEEPKGSISSARHTVSGTVTYASNGTAVEGASITVNASSATDTTDASGAYSLALDNGTYEITATKGDLANSITVTVNGSDLAGQDIVLSSETLTLDVPTQMFPNETAAYEVTLEGQDVSDAANVTSSDPTNLTVNQTSNELEATSDVSFAGEITITAEHDGLTASRNVTVANLSASNVALMQNAADMTAAIWGDVQGPDGTRPGGTQLTMRVLFVALLIGAAIATHASGFAGIGGITLIVVMGWFMGWVSDGMALVTVFTGLFIGLNLAANIDYSVRK